MMARSFGIPHLSERVSERAPFQMCMSLSLSDVEYQRLRSDLDKIGDTRLDQCVAE